MSLLVVTTEYRLEPTNIRGRILNYASLGRYGDDEEPEKSLGHVGR
jgi:hypothetical protein